MLAENGRVIRPFFLVAVDACRVGFPAHRRAIQE
jgi:hypothetical protein